MNCLGNLATALFASAADLIFTHHSGDHEVPFGAPLRYIEEKVLVGNDAMITRRRFLGAISAPAVATATVTLDPSGLHRALAAAEFGTDSPQQFAQNESAWREIQSAFTVDRTLINLNSGGVSPSTAATQAAMKRYLDYSNTAPVYSMWQVLEPQRESVRVQLAQLFGCDAEEIAITRNASESLQTCQFGFDLQAGDEILTTNQDYPRMLTTFDQRARREGISVKKIQLPVPLENPDEVVSLLERNITRCTRLILICHMINLTGQILPVKSIVQMARRHAVPVIVDGAHAFAHVPFTHQDLDCDYYGSSLHKWLLAPHGTGILYVRKSKIADLWPLMAAPHEIKDDIRKFEEIGTHPAANALAIGEAIAFHNALGPERKAARLRYLRDYWLEKLMVNDRIKVNTNLDAEYSCAIANVQVEGIDTTQLEEYLWEGHRVIVAGIKHTDFEGIRVSPNLFTTLPELDRFVEVIEDVLRRGIPAELPDRRKRRARR